MMPGSGAKVNNPRTLFFGGGDLSLSNVFG